MIFLPAAQPYRLSLLSYCLMLMLGGLTSKASCADSIQFNTDVLDVNDRKNIDLSQFAHSGYIMPGTYSMVVHVNKSDLPEQSVMFYAPQDKSNSSQACLTPDMVNQWGLKEDVLNTLSWDTRNNCLDENSLPGLTAQGDLSTSALYITIPQAYLDYISEDWDPPSRWDEGIPGILLDYNLNALSQRQQSGAQTYTLSGNGTAGGNIGPWRLRADWQANVSHQTGTNRAADNDLDWSRYYAYRSLRALRAKLTIGEDYLDSSVFDSFRFGGISLRSDDSMLPPNLRGYAPEVTGVAKSNAKVIIRQQGRVLYETTVASGPFRIQDLNDAVSGDLDVRVEEQDGSVQQFRVSTASIPYLTRPGSLRYKLATGKPSDIDHHYSGPNFGFGEFSWGVSNGWSLYGGTLLSEDYTSMAAGVGRDLMLLGALSFDVTQSRARLPYGDQTLSGASYRLSYSKSFDELDSQVTFAGYRFSEKNFMSMSEYLDAREYGRRVGSSKEMYTITYNQQFRDQGLSAYINFNHQTYWDRPDNDRYSVNLSRYFDIGKFKNISLSLSAYRNRYNERNDDGMYLSLSLPWGKGATVSYNTTLDRNDNTHRVGYYDQIDDRSNYQLNVGSSRSGANLNGYYSHNGDVARVSANASYQENRYSAFGVTAQGGMTLTGEGGALHRTNMVGGTRLLVDTEGVADIPVRGYGINSNTNRWGKAVVTDVNSYYRNRASIDLDRLGNNTEATKSVVQATLTEGAIGYRKFEVIAGEKAMVIIKLPDGSAPPFAATVLNVRQQETGIVNDGGSVYLSGINPREKMTVHWSGAAQCQIQMPDPLPPQTFTANLLLPCLPSRTAGGKNEL